MLLPTNEKRFELWEMRRSGMPDITMANLPGISRQAVSRALQLMDEKFETALCDMAVANRIVVEKINHEREILLGQSVPFRTEAIIFVSATHGVQVWYRHDGDCGTCPRYTGCIELLWDYTNELGIKIANTADPTKMAEELFSKVKEIVE